jgi:hypothetical protein
MQTSAWVRPFVSKIVSAAGCRSVNISILNISESLLFLAKVYFYQAVKMLPIFCSNDVFKYNEINNPNLCRYISTVMRLIKV